MLRAGKWRDEQRNIWPRCTCLEKLATHNTNSDDPPTKMDEILEIFQSTRGPNHQNQRQYRVLMNRTRYSKWLDQKQNFIDLKLDWHNSNCCCCCIRLHTLLTPENREYRFVFLGFKLYEIKKMIWQLVAKMFQTNKQTNKS